MKVELVLALEFAHLESNTIFFEFWDLPDPVLTGERLGLHQKLFLAQLVNVDEFTTLQVGQRFGLSEQRVNKYAKAVRKCRLMHDEGGRPPTVDKTGLDQIKTGLIAPVQPSRLAIN